MKKLTYADLLKKIEQKENFAFTRYGDGEWNAIFEVKQMSKGKETDAPGKNCDKHMYFPEMGQALAAALKENPTYYLGMQNLAMRMKGNYITAFLKNNKLPLPEMWGNADILHNASGSGNLSKFFNALKTVENVILTGPAYMKAISKYFTIHKYVEVPELNCWLEYDRIKNQTADLINSSTSKHTVVLFAASMPSNLLVHNLHKVFGNTVTLIDVGSVFDPFADKATRAYHRNNDIKKINGF